jgi:adenylate kinase family enzyme
MALHKLYSSDGTPHRRYVVVGTSGSGKSTLAAQLAEHLGYAHAELDALNWLPNWQMSAVEDFREQVDAVASRERWVIDGNYSAVRDLVWPRADAVIWLDRPFHVVMGRIIWRSFLRGWHNRELWNGCRGSLRRSFFSRESVILWAAQTWKKRHREYPELLRRPEYSHLDIFEVTSADLSEVDVRRGSVTGT